MLYRTILLAAAAVFAAWGAQITPADFVSPTVESFPLGTESFFPGSCGSFIECTSTPLTIRGITYSTGLGTLDFGLFSNCHSNASAGSGCILSPGDTGFFDITLPTPMLRAGGYFSESASSTGQALFEFFDAGNHLLGSVTSSSFGGWQDAAGIERIRVTDQSVNGSSPLFDDLTFEGPVSAPEPSSLLLAGGGMIILWHLRRRLAARIATPAQSTTRV